MTTRLTLICHAPTAATRAARFPIDEGTDVDALTRASVLARPEAGRTLVGPERRTRETAAALGCGAEADAALRDQDFGRWAGLAPADLATTEPDGLAIWTGDPDAAPHGGESVAALLRRVEGWLADRAAAGGRVTAVTHPAVVRAAVSAALGAGAPCFWRIEAPPLASATLSHDGRRWSLVELRPPPSRGAAAISRAGSARSNP